MAIQQDNSYGLFDFLGDAFSFVALSSFIRYGGGYLNRFAGNILRSNKRFEPYTYRSVNRIKDGNYSATNIISNTDYFKNTRASIYLDNFRERTLLENKYFKRDVTPFSDLSSYGLRQKRSDIARARLRRFTKENSYIYGLEAGLVGGSALLSEDRSVAGSIASFLPFSIGIDVAAGYGLNYLRNRGGNIRNYTKKLFAYRTNKGIEDFKSRTHASADATTDFIQQGLFRVIYNVLGYNYLNSINKKNYISGISGEGASINLSSVNINRKDHDNIRKLLQANNREIFDSNQVVTLNKDDTFNAGDKRLLLNLGGKQFLFKGDFYVDTNNLKNYSLNKVVNGEKIPIAKVNNQHETALSDYFSKINKGPRVVNAIRELLSSNVYNKSIEIDNVKQTYLGLKSSVLKLKNEQIRKFRNNNKNNSFFQKLNNNEEETLKFFEDINNNGYKNTDSYYSRIFKINNRDERKQYISDVYLKYYQNKTPFDDIYYDFFLNKENKKILDELKKKYNFTDDIGADVKYIQSTNFIQKVDNTNIDAETSLGIVKYIRDNDLIEDVNKYLVRSVDDSFNTGSFINSNDVDVHFNVFSRNTEYGNLGVSDVLPTFYSRTVRNVSRTLFPFSSATGDVLDPINTIKDLTLGTLTLGTGFFGASLINEGIESVSGNQFSLVGGGFNLLRDIRLSHQQIAEYTGVQYLYENVLNYEQDKKVFGTVAGLGSLYGLSRFLNRRGVAGGSYIGAGVSSLFGFGILPVYGYYDLSDNKEELYAYHTGLVREAVPLQRGWETSYNSPLEGYGKQFYGYSGLSQYNYNQTEYSNYDRPYIRDDYISSLFPFKFIFLGGEIFSTNLHPKLNNYLQNYKDYNVFFPTVSREDNLHGVSDQNIGRFLELADVSSQSLQTVRKRADLLSGVYGLPSYVFLEKSFDNFNIDYGEYVPLTSSQESVGRYLRDLRLGNFFGFGEYFRRVLLDYSSDNAVYNLLPNTQPKYLPLIYQFGDAYTKLYQGEIRLPSIEYEKKNNVDYSFPIFAELFGKTYQEIADIYTGNRYANNDFSYYGEVAKQGIISSVDVNDRNVLVYNNRNYGRIDIANYFNDGIAQIFPVESSVLSSLSKPLEKDVRHVNALLNYSNRDKATIIYIDEKGNKKQFKQNFNQQLYIESLHEVYEERDKALQYIKSGNYEKGSNLGEAYSISDKLLILAETSPFSKEFKTTLEQVKFLNERGELTESEQRKFSLALLRYQNIANSTNEDDNYINNDGVRESLYKSNNLLVTKFLGYGDKQDLINIRNAFKDKEIFNVSDLYKGVYEANANANVYERASSLSLFNALLFGSSPFTAAASVVGTVHPNFNGDVRNEDLGGREYYIRN